MSKNDLLDGLWMCVVGLGFLLAAIAALCAGLFVLFVAVHFGAWLGMWEV